MAINFWVINYIFKTFLLLLLLITKKHRTFATCPKILLSTRVQAFLFGHVKCRKVSPSQVGSTSRYARKRPEPQPSSPSLSFRLPCMHHKLHCCCSKHHIMTRRSLSNVSAVSLAKKIVLSASLQTLVLLMSLSVGIHQRRIGCLARSQFSSNVVELTPKNWKEVVVESP